jgi:hypothetical protein
MEFLSEFIKSLLIYQFSYESNHFEKLPLYINFIWRVTMPRKTINRIRKIKTKANKNLVRDQNHPLQLKKN